MTKDRFVEPPDLFRLKFITGATLSPDGKHAVYSLQTIDAEKEETRSGLWLLTLETGESRALTSGQANDTAPAWSPDGQQIAFLSTRSGKTQVYAIAVDGGEARALTSMEQGAGGGPDWSPDGKWIAFTAGPQGEPPDPKKPYRVTRSILRFDGIGYLDPTIQDIYVLPVKGGKPRRITHDGCYHLSPRWSPDGQEILNLFMAKPDSHYPETSLQVVDRLGKVIFTMEGWGEVDAAAWLPDSRGIAIVGQPAGKPIGSKNDLWVLPRRGGEPECRTRGLIYAVGSGIQPDFPFERGPSIQVSQDGSCVYLNVQQGGTIQIYRIALSGAEDWQPVVSGERSCIPLGVSARELLFGVSSLDNPFDLRVCRLDGSGEKRLTQVNQKLISTWNLPSVEHLQFEGLDGVPVEGWMLKPAGQKPPYPTILYIHGGPHSAFGNMFSFDFQMLAGAGYGVLFVNHRASLGYGDSFSTAIKGDWGNLDYHDLMGGVDCAIQRGLADPARLGCCGLSGGGNLSCWIVGHTDRFKAAVPENPVTNWASFYGVSDIGPWFAVEELGGHPHEIPEIYARCSPITYAHNCKTPTLLIQGEADYRCPAEQSEQFYTALKVNGCVVEMLRLPNSSHAGSIFGAPAVRKAQNQALLAWMNRYVLGKPSQAE